MLRRDEVLAAALAYPVFHRRFGDVLIAPPCVLVSGAVMKLPVKWPCLSRKLGCVLASTGKLATDSRRAAIRTREAENIISPVPPLWRALHVVRISRTQC